MSNDPLEVAPHMHKLVFENEKCRVLEVTARPGDKAAMHRHPENIMYVKSGGTMRFIDPAGETRELTLHEGQVIHIPNEVFHEGENIGSTEVNLVQIELKSKLHTGFRIGVRNDTVKKLYEQQVTDKSTFKTRNFRITIV